MTQFDHKKASELIAKLFKLKSSKVHVAIEKYIGDELASVKYTQWFITQDSGAMAELAWENFLSVAVRENSSNPVVVVRGVVDGTALCLACLYSKDHTSIAEATRVAIAKALIKKVGG